jgi:hypothetical protein
MSPLTLQMSKNVIRKTARGGLVPAARFGEARLMRPASRTAAAHAGHPGS